MKRCSIVIHSVSGNCYIIGSYLKEALEKRNVDVRFYRVEDPDLHIWANKEETANDYYEDIIKKLYKPAKKSTMGQVITQTEINFDVEPAKEPEKAVETEPEPEPDPEPEPTILGKWKIWLKSMMSDVVDE